MKLNILTQNIKGFEKANSFREKDIEKIIRDSGEEIHIISLTEVSWEILNSLKGKFVSLNGKQYQVYVPKKCVKEGKCKYCSRALGTGILVERTFNESYNFIQKPSKNVEKYMMHNKKNCDMREVILYSERIGLEIISVYIPAIPAKKEFYRKYIIKAREGILPDIFKEMREKDKKHEPFIYLGDFNFFLKDPNKESENYMKKHREVLNSSYKENKVSEFDSEVRSTYIDKNVEGSWEGNDKSIDYIFTNINVEKFYNKDYFAGEEKRNYDHTTLISILDVD